jgi:threonine dehydrogenase-like Zn-dependent dehydrogenase
VSVHVLGRSSPSLAFARSLRVAQVWTSQTLPDLPFDAVVDASDAAELPALALERVEPGGRVVLVGLADRPSLVDSRRVVLTDVTVVGVLSASGGLQGAIDLFAGGRVDPRRLVAATVGLDDVAAVLAGERDSSWGPGPKVHVDPTR